MTDQDPGELPDIDYIIVTFEAEKAARSLPDWVVSLEEYCTYKASKPGDNRWKIHEECRRFLLHLAHHGGQIQPGS